jgi:hypothetical protein
MSFGYSNTFLLIDKGLIELFAPSGFSYYLKDQSKGTSSKQTGFISNYSFTMIISAFLIISCYLYCYAITFYTATYTFIALLVCYSWFSLFYSRV